VLFALPWTARWLFDLIGTVDRGQGWLVTAPDSTDPYSVLFANLMGGVATVWAVFRIAQPSLAAGLADTGARALWAIAIIVALANGSSPLLWGLLVLGIAWGLLQAIAVATAGRRVVDREKLP